MGKSSNDPVLTGLICGGLCRAARIKSGKSFC
jgi:hypothetical protein